MSSAEAGEPGVPRQPAPGNCAGAPSSEAAAICANVSGMLLVLLRMRVNVYYTVRVPLC